MRADEGRCRRQRARGPLAGPHRSHRPQPVVRLSHRRSMTMRVSRRSLLHGVGAGTAAFLGGGFERQAFGDGVIPKRLLVLYMPNCSIRANWAVTGGRTPESGTGDATTFTLGTANSTLMPASQYMTLVDGLDQKNIGGDPHGSGIIRLMSGGTIQAGEGAKDPGGGSLGAGNLPLKP